MHSDVLFLFWYSTFLSWQFFLNCISEECNWIVNSQMDISGVARRTELSSKDKNAGKSMSTIQILFLIIQKLVWKYHVEVEWIICGKNLVVNFDFDNKFLLLYSKIVKCSIDICSFYNSWFVEQKEVGGIDYQQ